MGGELIHDSNVTVVARNLMFIKITVGSQGSGEFFLENIGPRTQVNTERVNVWIRQTKSRNCGCKQSRWNDVDTGE